MLRRTPLKTKTCLKTKMSLRDSYAEKVRNGGGSLSQDKPARSLRNSYAAKIISGEKKQYRAKMHIKDLKKMGSVLTADMTKCYMTGDKVRIHIHHIFGGANKEHSEKYGFLIPLRDDWHNMASYGVHNNRDLDLKLKRLCQDYWLQNYGTQEEFIATFGKWW